MSLEAAPLKSKAQVPVRQPDSPWRIAIRRFSRNRLALAGLLILVMMVLICCFGPWISPFSINDYKVIDKNQSPSSTHWLGTDKLGRDVLLRVMLAGRISIMVGVVATFISVVLGATLGALAGFYRKFIDSFIMRIAEIFMSIPTLPLLIILGALLSDLKVPPQDRIYF